MNDEPQHQPIRDDDGEAATKADVREAVEELARATNSAITAELKPIRSDIAAVKDDVAGLKQDVAELKDGQARLENDMVHLRGSQQAILDVVKSIDQQLREHNTLPDRVARLERSVFRR